MTPRLYEFDFTSGVYEYDLPDYIHPPMDVEIRTPKYYLHGIFVSEGDDMTFTWSPIYSWRIEPAGDGGYKLRMGTYPISQSGRIIWYTQQGAVPPVENLPQLTASIDSEDTSLTVDVALDYISDSGYVRVESEWIGYSGVTYDASTTTLESLTRGAYNSVAASHITTTEVEWGVAVDDLGLYNQLNMRAIANVHAQLLHKSAGEDNEHHQRMLSYYRDESDRWWRRYRPGRKTKFKLAPQAFGAGVH